jgi:hypothetical protein
MPVALYRALETTDDCSYVLTADLRLVRTNAAWTRFARLNGGEALLLRWTRNASILDAMSGELQTFYREAFARVLATGQRWDHDYECSSDQVYRSYRMLVFPVGQNFLVVTNSLRLERPHDHVAIAANDADYVHDGVIRMCANCRRVRVVGSIERWDWVPDYVRTMRPNVSHGLCAACAATYKL